MIEIKTIGVWGFEGAMHGMRMAYESFDKSDSHPSLGYSIAGIGTPEEFCKRCQIDDCYYCPGYIIGEADMALCKKLIKGGSEHRKPLRSIHVQADVKAPRYWWAEADKYKLLETNSSSTMHLITKRELTLDDFSISSPDVVMGLEYSLEIINRNIKAYNRESDRKLRKIYFNTIKQMLPESYKQLRMIDTNYECLLSIYHQRKNHRLSEWSGENGFCSWILSLPYMSEFVEAMNDK